MIERLIAIKWLPPVFFAAAVLGIYGTCLNHDFLTMWDDDLYIISNEAVRGFSFKNIVLAFKTNYGGNFAPVHIISYMFDYTLWGLSPAGFIGGNLLLHALNGWLLYLLLSSLYGVGTAPLLAALLFVVHPVHVESVAWISERKNVLSLFFMLLSLLLYVQDRVSRDRDQKTTYRYYASLIFFLLALLTKSIAVVLPAIIFGWEVLVFRRSDWKNSVRSVLPYILLGIIFTLVTIFTQGSGGGLPFRSRPFDYTFYTMLPVFWTYVKMILAPLDLSPWYEQTIRTGFDAAVVIALLLFSLLFVGIIQLVRKGLYRELFWVAVFLAALLPVSNLIPIVTMMNDRYLYVPMVGVSGVVCSVLVRYGPGFSARIPVIIIIAVFAVLSFRQTAVWKNNVTLWNAAVIKNPGNVQVMERLARSYGSIGKQDKALEILQQAIAIEPDNEAVLHRLGQLLLEAGDTAQARMYLERMYRRNPKYTDGLLTIGMEALVRKSYTEAERYFREALHVSPQNTAAGIWLSNVLTETGKRGEARALLEAALAYSGWSDKGGIYYNLSLLDIIEKKYPQALKHIALAAETGFSDFELISGTPDFDVLRENDEFRIIIAKIRNNGSAR